MAQYKLGVFVPIIVITLTALIIVSVLFIAPQNNNITNDTITNKYNNSFAYKEFYDSTDELQYQLSNLKCQVQSKIYIDFIYNPHYYHEFIVLRFILSEILNKNKNLRFEYDYDNMPDSTLITVGNEHIMFDTNERTIIQIKPKLLKDILYTDNIFQQIYQFLLTSLRICDPVNVPEYDRSIDFIRYREIFKNEIGEIDHFTPNVCRNDEVFGLYNGSICITSDDEYIKSINFLHPETREYWLTLLDRTAKFMNILLSKTFETLKTDKQYNCYSIKLRPEIDIRKVLLFSHKAVKTATLDEYKKFDDKNSRNQIINDIILFKHRILHALGLSHRYSLKSVMNSYGKPWQKPNVFYILPEDYKSLWSCYGKNISYAPSKYVQNKTLLNRELINAFHHNFETFIDLYEKQ